MAKQIVREYDLSQSTLPSYSNFSVVVPGYVNTAKEGNFKKVADENYVYEVNSIADFEENIGYVPGTPLSANAPVLEVLDTKEEEGEIINIYTKQLTISEAYEYLVAGTLYLPVAKEVASDTVGYLQDKDFTYDPVTKLDDSEDFEVIEEDPLTIVTKAEYAVIKPENRGNDERASNQMGNQIAYELIKLGYTVLYKGILGGSTEAILSTTDFWAPLKDKSIYSFRYLTTGGYFDTEAMNRISEVATFKNSVTLEEAETINDTNGRGDVIALCDIDESLFGTSISGPKALIIATNNAAKGLTSADKFSAIFAPRVVYSLPTIDTKPFDNNETFPASFHYLACAAYSHEIFAEYFAVAGYKRGVSKLTVKGTTYNYGNIAQNTLAPRNIYPIDSANSVTKSINLIINERGSYYIWGNRTAEPLSVSAPLKWSHYLNVRQLCTTLKKQVIYAGRMYAFDPNSDVLWTNFRTYIENLLLKIKGNQGIDDYEITPVRDKTKGALKAKIRIVPIEAVEDFDVGLFLEDDLTATNVNAVESD